MAIGPRMLDVGELVALVAGDEPGAHGAVVTFVGIVRGLNQGRKVIRLEYEAYEPLALRAFAIIRDEVAAHWPSARVAFHHRTGPIALGEASVAIAAASPRRADAFAACRYVIERLKQRHFAFSFQHFSYDGAGHLLAGPSRLAPARSIGAGDMAIGGTESANAAARDDAWAKACTFFGTYLK